MMFDGGSLAYLIAAIVGILIIVGLASWVARRRFAKLDVQKYASRWQDIQQLCASENTWPLAVINADKLLDDALKQCRYKGKTMGERLVAAQHNLSDNDAVWFGHKLRNRLVHEEVDKLKKRQVQKVLLGFRQALRDLGALR